MLLELSIGDAYGAGFEYVSPKFVQRHNDLSGYVAHPWHDLTPGCYTDDTQMSIAIAELLVSGKPWIPVNIAASFVSAFNRDQRKGYSNRFFKLLKSIKNGQQFLDLIDNSSEKSGAAMRAAPIGLLSDIDNPLCQDRCRLN
jgi:ADP-ribosyl-[dinitrogen reductase] hydrolase